MSLCVCVDARIQPEINYLLEDTINLYYGLKTARSGKFEQESRNYLTLTKVCKKFTILMNFLYYNSHFVFHSPFLFVFFSFLYFSSSFFFILILYLILFIFFSSMCHNWCCSGLIG